MNTETIASICHEANKALCESAGDYSQVSWDKAEQWQKDSAIQGVLFLINNPDAAEDVLHNQWCDQKYADGWVYGLVKDPVIKTHPCLVAFKDLPKLQQAKDHLFKAIVNALSRF